MSQVGCFGFIILEVEDQTGRLHGKTPDCSEEIKPVPTPPDTEPPVPLPDSDWVSLSRGWNEGGSF